MNKSVCQGLGPLVLVCCLIASPSGPSALAQSDPSFLYAKEIAKAKFDASRADVHVLEQEKIKPAREGYEARQSEFLAGRGTLDILYEVSRQLLDAEISTSIGPSEKVAALQRFWNRALLVEMTNEWRYVRGRLAYKETRESQYERLNAEIQLAHLRGVEPSFDFLGREVALDFLNSKELAKQKRGAALADAHDLAVQRLDAIMDAYPGRLLEFLAGRGTLDIDLETSRRWLEAERALARGPKDQISALERHWETDWVIETVNKARYDAGRIASQDFFQSLHALLQVEIEFLKLRKSPPGEIPWTGGRLAGFLLWVWESDRLGGLKQMAKDKFEVGLSTREHLLRESLAAVRGEFMARTEEFLNGRGTFDIVLENDQNLLAAECAVAKNQEERLAAFVKHFEHAALFEAVNRARYGAQRIAIQDYLQAVYERLDAELLLLKERQKAAGR